MNSIVLGIAQQHDAQRIIKGKSMVTEETALLHHLQRANLDVVETDLGEYIIQLRNEGYSLRVASVLIERERIDEIIRTGSLEEINEHFKKVFEPMNRESPSLEEFDAAAETIKKGGS